MSGIFHTHDGWYFQRLDDGTVHITKRKNGPGFGDGEIIEEHKLDPSSWASVVSHVSSAGETGPTYQTALAFHGGKL